MDIATFDRNRIGVKDVRIDLTGEVSGDRVSTSTDVAGHASVQVNAEKYFVEVNEPKGFRTNDRPMLWASTSVLKIGLQRTGSLWGKIESLNTAGACEVQLLRVSVVKGVYGVSQPAATATQVLLEFLFEEVLPGKYVLKALCEGKGAAGAKFSGLAPDLGLGLVDPSITVSEGQRTRADVEVRETRTGQLKIVVKQNSKCNSEVELQPSNVWSTGHPLTVKLAEAEGGQCLVVTDAVAGLYNIILRMGKDKSRLAVVDLHSSRDSAIELRPEDTGQVVLKIETAGRSDIREILLESGQYRKMRNAGVPAEDGKWLFSGLPASLYRPRLILNPSSNLQFTKLSCSPSSSLMTIQVLPGEIVQCVVTAANQDAALQINVPEKLRKERLMLFIVQSDSDYSVSVLDELKKGFIQVPRLLPGSLAVCAFRPEFVLDPSDPVVWAEIMNNGARQELRKGVISEVELKLCRNSD